MAKFNATTPENHYLRNIISNRLKLKLKNT